VRPGGFRRVGSPAGNEWFCAVSNRETRTEKLSSAIVLVCGGVSYGYKE